MSSAGSYPVRSFSETQTFLVYDPSTSTTVRVKGSDLVNYITPSLNSVMTETTTDALVNEDYRVGSVVQTTGQSAPGDGSSGLFLVVQSGEGDIPMFNGNELLVLSGANTAAGISYDNTTSGIPSGNVQGALDDLDVAVDDRVVRVSSRTEMKAYDAPPGYQFSLDEGGRSGKFVVKSGTPPSDPQEGVYVVLNNGNYAERIIDGPINILWFGAKKDNTGFNSGPAINAAIALVSVIEPGSGLRYGKQVYIPSGLYETSVQIDVQQAGVRLVGDGPATSVIKAQTGFSGSAVIYATPPNTTSTLVGHGVIGLGIDCNLQACDGYIGEMLYDNVLFDDFRISKIAAAQSGFVCRLKSGHTLPVNQTVSIRKLFSSKIDEAGTVPSVIIKNTQEIMIQESKAWNSNVANSGDQPAWLVDSCRSLTMIGCSYVNSKIGLRVTTTDRSCDQIQIIAPLYENVGIPVKTDSGAGTNPVDNFYHVNPRHQNAASDGYDIDRTRISFLETGSANVTLGANSQTTTVGTNNLPLVTDNGSDNMRVSIRNAVNDFQQFGHNLSVKPGADEFFRTAASGSELGGTIQAGFLIGGSVVLKQVLAGASDSGGTGFRTLRIAN